MNLPGASTINFRVPCHDHGPLKRGDPGIVRSPMDSSDILDCDNRLFCTDISEAAFIIAKGRRSPHEMQVQWKEIVIIVFDTFSDSNKWFHRISVRGDARCEIQSLCVAVDRHEDWRIGVAERNHYFHPVIADRIRAAGFARIEDELPWDPFSFLSSMLD
jgi:hypothetical protein